MLKKKEQICILIMLIICMLLSFIFVFCKVDNNSKKVLAEISVNGALYDTVSLDEFKEYNINTEYGYNHVLVDNGSIWIDEADCADHTCINKGKIHNIGDTIICLPHRICITIIED